MVLLCGAAACLSPQSPVSFCCPSMVSVQAGQNGLLPVPWPPTYVPSGLLPGPHPCLLPVRPLLEEPWPAARLTWSLTHLYPVCPLVLLRASRLFFETRCHYIVQVAILSTPNSWVQGVLFGFPSSWDCRYMPVLGLGGTGCMGKTSNSVLLKLKVKLIYTQICKPGIQENYLGW